MRGGGKVFLSRLKGSLSSVVICQNGTPGRRRERKHPPEEEAKEERTKHVVFAI